MHQSQEALFSSVHLAYSILAVKPSLKILNENFDKIPVLTISNYIPTNIQLLENANSTALNLTALPSPLKLSRSVQSYNGINSAPSSKEFVPSLQCNTQHSSKAIQCTMGNLNTGVKSSQLWKLISPWILTQKFQYIPQRSLNSPKI